MTHYADPESRALEAERHAAAVTEFRTIAAREPALGRALFECRLIALRMTPREIATEIVLYAPRLTGANLSEMR